MNRVTIYRSDGSIYRELDCKRFDQYYGGPICEITTTDGKVIRTNMPVVVTGNDFSPSVSIRQPDSHELKNTFDVSLILGDSRERFTKLWEGACMLNQCGSLVCFWFKDKAVVVSGPVVIENFHG